MLEGPEKILLNHGQSS